MATSKNILTNLYDNVHDAHQMIGRTVVMIDPEVEMLVEIPPVEVMGVFSLMIQGEPTMVCRLNLDGVPTDCWGRYLIDAEGLMDEYLETMVEECDDPELVWELALSAQKLRQ